MFPLMQRCCYFMKQSCSEGGTPDIFCSWNSNTEPATKDWHAWKKHLTMERQTNALHAAVSYTPAAPKDVTAMSPAATFPTLPRVMW